MPEVGLELHYSPRHWEPAEHVEYGPIRRQYELLRNQECGHCPHSLCLRNMAVLAAAPVISTTGTFQVLEDRRATALGTTVLRQTFRLIWEMQ